MGRVLQFSRCVVNQSVTLAGIALSVTLLECFSIGYAAGFVIMFVAGRIVRISLFGIRLTAVISVFVSLFSLVRDWVIVIAVTISISISRVIRVIRVIRTVPIPVWVPVMISCPIAPVRISSPADPVRSYKRPMDNNHS